MTFKNMTYLPKRVELKNLIKWLFSLKYTLHRALFTSRRWKKQSFCTHKLWPKKKNEKKTPDRRFCLIFCFQMKQEDCNLATGLHMWSQSLNSVLNYLTNYSTTNFSYFYLFFGVCVCVCVIASWNVSSHVRPLLSAYDVKLKLNEWCLCACTLFNDMLAYIYTDRTAAAMCGILTFLLHTQS